MSSGWGQMKTNAVIKKNTCLLINAWIIYDW